MPYRVNPLDTFEFFAAGKQLTAANRAALLEFANKVREAGGGTPLSALMPSVPQNHQQCLIARALNFSCAVGPEQGIDVERFPSGAIRWVMRVSSEEKTIEIAKSAGLDLRFEGLNLVLLLPEEIGNAARAFDLHHSEFTGLTEAY